jgi:hypothetical protein
MRTKPKTAAERQTALRARGRQIALVLRDEAAIAELDRLAAEHGSQRAAIEHLLQQSVRRGR